MKFQNQGLKTGSFAVTHGRTPIEQNEVPKSGPQNRQFCGDAWAYPHSNFPFKILLKSASKSSFRRFGVEIRTSLFWLAIACALLVWFSLVA